LLALAVALAAAVGDGSAGPWPYLAAALIAGALGWLPSRTTRAA
jgi:hypothetical protein